MGYKGKSDQGEVPESGAIFMSNSGTKEECLERKLFGLPSSFSDFVLHVKKGMILFLFEFERRLLYGVFRATCDGDINIEPKAFRKSGYNFPAQVRFTTIWDCSPLAEHEFQGVIRDNYFAKKKFHFGLNKKQVSKLMKLFRSKSFSETRPERSIWRYDDKPAEGNARSKDLRKDIRHRIRFDSCDLRDDEVKEVDDNMYKRKRIIESRQKDKREEYLAHYKAESDEFGDCGRHEILGKHLDLREKLNEDRDMPGFSKENGKHLDEIGGGSSDYLMDVENKDLIDYNRLQDEYKVREGFQGFPNGHDMLGKHLAFREKHIEDGYVPGFSQMHGKHLDETGAGSSHFLMDGNNKDIIDYNRLVDEYKVREGLKEILNERPLTNHLFSHFNQNAYPNCDPTRLVAPDIQLGPCFDDGLSFIPVDDNYPYYPSPEKIPESESLPYYQHEGSIRYLGDPGSQSSIFPKFISRNLSSSDAGLHVHEVEPTDNDKRFREKHEYNCTSGTSNKRVSVFSRLASTLKQEEQAFENDENHELNASVDKVMQMLEKVVSKPIKRTRKHIPVIKKDGYVNSPESKSEDHEFPDEEVDSDSVLRETRLVDFKRRKILDKRVDGKSKESYECLVRSTSHVGPVETDQLTDMPRKRRKLVRPAFVEKNLIPDGIGAHENAHLKRTDRCEDSENVAVSAKVVEISEKVDASIKSSDDISMVPTSLESTLSENVNVSTKVIETSEKVDAVINSTDDLTMVRTSLETTISEKDTFSTKVVETSDQVDAVMRTSREDTLSEKDTVETSDKVDAVIQTSIEDAHSEKGTVSTKVVETSSEKDTVETSDKVDAVIRTSIEDALSEKGTVLSKVVETLSEKDTVETLDKVDAVIRTSLEDALSEKGTVSTKVVETSGKVDAVLKSSDDIITLQTSGENTLSENDSISKKVSETFEKVGAVIKSTDDITMVPTSRENTSSENSTISTEVAESSQQVHAVIKFMEDIITVPTSLENTPFDSYSTKAGIESSKKADVSIKSIDLNMMPTDSNMMPTSDEISPFKDDNNSTNLRLSLHLATAECQERGNKGDGNAENRLVSDVSVEATQVASRKNEEMVCGWIEW